MGLQAIVSQGCRPVGPIFTVTKTTGNALEELMESGSAKTSKVANDASAEDRKLMSAAGYLVGIASANGVERGTSSSRTDFLIRQIIGFQPDKGAVVVGSRDVQLGDRVRFHERCTGRQR
ncbi:FIST C [Fragilaria crotonensis]|nr:FIST C [Fragilaria crotonensis]